MNVIAMGFMILTVLVGGISILVSATGLSSLTARLPEAETLGAMWGTLGAEVYSPVQLLDQSGEHVLYEYYADTEEDPLWVRIRPGAEHAVPEYLINAVLAALDPTFWENPGFSQEALIQLGGDLLAGSIRATEKKSITELLAEATLLPLTLDGLSTFEQVAQRLILAREITLNFSKATILEWFLNSADFGNHAYGVDAASLFYFGIHASELDLGQSAALAAMLANNRLELDAGELSRAQADVLESMQQMQMISPAESTQAGWDEDEANLRRESPPSEAPFIAAYVEERMTQAFGAEVMGRPGLRITSSIDYDLQLQIDCVAATQLARLGGGNSAETLPAQDGSACVAAGLLPPLRPGDSGRNHVAESVAMLVLDNNSGLIRAVTGDVRSTHPSGEIVYPFVYLTAFTQGYAPGSMVLDIWANDDFISGDEHGPVLMRTALQHGYTAAATRVLELIGRDAFERTLRSMGVDISELFDDAENAVEPGWAQFSILDAVYSYSIIANEGIVHTRDLGGMEGSRPSAIQSVRDAGGEVLVHENLPQAVLSSPLAYLLIDILRDESAYWDLYGHGSPLELGRASASITAESPADDGSWVVGFTPDVTVGVWMGGTSSPTEEAVSPINGPAPIWHAVMRYATRTVDQRRDWALPVGVTEIEICSPSGLLPTEYCPLIVREVFIQGTEPTQADNLYQPIRINRETGNLATLYTPSALVEERVYLIPPAGAEAWAQIAGIDQPPHEFDVLLADDGSGGGEVSILSPQSFDIVRGDITIRGRVRPEEFDFFRLQVGEGLNPTRWIQIGEDEDTPVYSGTLADFDTRDLNGLYTIQLIAVLADGVLITDAVTLTIDNQPPDVSILAPDPFSLLELARGEEVRIQVSAWDAVGIDRVVLYADNQRVAEAGRAPYTFLWSSEDIGEHLLTARGYDLAGNFNHSESVQVIVVP
ncbi:MAG: penicillin-binding protein [Anaerolineales bacterium]|nr:penicillin-binding protein [Anaerolineales bacterium]